MSTHLDTNLLLVTGTLGWLGRNLVHGLAHGLDDFKEVWTPPRDLKIRALILPEEDENEAKQISDRVEVVRGDICNPLDCARFCSDASGAVLFHAAAVIHPRRVREFFRVNLTGSKNLLDAAIAAGVRRAVVVSSNTPCGFNPRPDHLFDERSPYKPWGRYGRSKMLMELAVEKRQQAGQIEAATVRAPWFYGPHQPPRQTLFFKMVRDGRMPIVGGGDNRRSMVYVDNLVQGLILAAITEKADGQVYWIADERSYTMNEIVDTVEHLLENEFGQQCAHKRRRLPSIASTIASLTTRAVQSVGLHWRNVHVLSEMNKTIACRIAKARNELGYAPKIGLEKGMRRSIRWLLSNSKDGGFLQ